MDQEPETSRTLRHIVRQLIEGERNMQTDLLLVIQAYDDASPVEDRILPTVPARLQKAASKRYRD